MTIKEAIKRIEDHIRIHGKEEKFRAVNIQEALKMAVDALKALEWISVEDRLPEERDTIFAKFYGTDKWRDAMFRKMSDDVRVIKVYSDGTKSVHHDHTVDGVWDSERKGVNIYGRVTHWIANPGLPKEDT